MESPSGNHVGSSTPDLLSTATAGVPPPRRNNVDLPWFVAKEACLHTPPGPLLQSNLPLEAFVNRLRIVAHTALENDLRLFDHRDVFREIAIE